MALVPRKGRRMARMYRGFQDGYMAGDPIVVIVHDERGTRPLEFPGGERAPALNARDFRWGYDGAGPRVLST